MVNPEVFDIWRPYSVAPMTRLQLKAGARVENEAELVGETRAGTLGRPVTVEKLQVPDHALVPVALVAFACQ